MVLKKLQKNKMSNFMFPTNKQVVHNNYLLERDSIVDFIFSPYNLYLLVTNNCNLACRYCYASKVTRDLKKQVMPFSIAKKSVDFLFSQEKEYYQIAFFGGEPLMNFDLIKKVVSYCQGKNKNVRFFINTNATLLNEENILFMKQNDFNIVVSLDGGKEVQNFCRPFKGGQGTFEIVKKKIVLLQKLYQLDYISMVVNKKNLNICDQIKKLIDEGIESNFHLELITSNDPELILDEEDMSKLNKEFKKITTLMIDTWNNEEKLIRIDNFLTNIPLVNKSPTFPKQYHCNGFTGHFSVAYNGDVYPCSHFIGDNRFITGNIVTGINIKKINSLIDKININNREHCLDCDIKNICGGGCHYVPYFYYGQLNKQHNVFCKFQKLCFEQTLKWYPIMGQADQKENKKIE
jgi:uncharacterized protein